MSERYDALTGGTLAAVARFFFPPALSFTVFFFFFCLSPFIILVSQFNCFLYGGSGKKPAPGAPPPAKWKPSAGKRPVDWRDVYFSEMRARLSKYVFTERATV
jgi:hypothetical protein